MRSPTVLVRTIFVGCHRCAHWLQQLAGADSASDRRQFGASTILKRTVVITGTSSGFGRKAVEKFVSEGWNVVATVRKSSDLNIHDDLNNVSTLLLDVDDESADAAFAERAIAQFGTS
jgi:hypothetical protein